MITHSGIVVVACFVACTLLAFCPNEVATISCKDANGSDVDWFMVLKAPKIEDDQGMAAEGVAFVYLDSNNNQFTVSSTSIGDSSVAIGATLQQIYGMSSSDKQQTGYVMYNDETPAGKDSDSKAHAKGALAFDSQSGFWLIHSVPRYPAPFSSTSQYQYPNNEVIYGQSFLCVTYDAASFNDIAAQLTVYDTQVYDSNITPELQQIAPNMNTVINRPRGHTAPLSVSKKLQSSQGTNFVSFAKNSQWGQDLYSNLVETTFQTSLYIETWMRPNQPSTCGTYNSLNVQEVNLGPAPSGSGSMTFVETKDHSKWAISTDSSQPWVCIGDINRNVSQYKRGGGTCCLNNGAVWKQFSAVISKADSC